MFGNTNSSWGHLPWKHSSFFDPVSSELIRVPAFRQLLARELARTTPCGVMEWRGSNYVSFQLTNFMNLSGSRTISLAEADRPAVGAKVELRWCDWIALSLANSKQIPAFNPFAPMDQRDEVVAGARALLGR